ncbi:MAG TPA: hypothetical protein VGL86_12310 [Polyangia bacterium]
MWKRTLVALPVALITLALLGGAEGIDGDELACEAAVKHLIDCCPTGAPATTLDCYAGRGCDTTKPDLDAAQSSQFLAESCRELDDSGACQTAPPPPSSSTEEQGE